MARKKKSMVLLPPLFPNTSNVPKTSLSDSQIKSLAMLKMEKNFVAVIEKQYPRRPYEHYDFEFLRKRLLQEVNELNEALKQQKTEASKLECADVSNMIDYIFEKLMNVKDAKKLDQNSRCPECGAQLILKKFVDAWHEDRTPSKEDINEDLYCPECDLRWSPEYGPHNFAELEETP